MGVRFRSTAAVVLAGLLAGAAAGQLPGVPAGPVPPTAAAGAAGALPTVGGAPVAAAGAAPAAAPKNLFSFFHKTPEQAAQHKASFCNHPLGKMVNSALRPLGALTGGALGPICPDPRTTPNPNDLNKPSTGAQGAAAKIKAEEAQAGAKIAAIQYLATVDCRYYPEAEAALINGLRAEKNECVRVAAAKALNKGCCCTAKVVKALTIAVNGDAPDGFPAERSECVKALAYVALERCLRACPSPGDPDVPPEAPPEAGGKPDKRAAAVVGADGGVVLTAYYDALDRKAESVWTDARLALARGLRVSAATLAKLSPAKSLKEAVIPAVAYETVGPAPAPPGNTEGPAETMPPVAGRRRNLVDLVRDAVGR